MRPIILVTTVLSAFVICGCDPIVDPTGGGVVETERNNRFNDANFVVAYPEDGARVGGSIDDADDVDVFAFGSFDAGDRITVSADPLTTSDLTVAVFDEFQRLIAIGGDGNGGGMNVDTVARRSGAGFFVAVASTPGSGGFGPYSLSIRLARGGEPPTRRRQALLLDFDGGSVVVRDDLTVTVGPFNAGNVDDAYAGLTDEMKSAITETVRERFAPFGVDVFDTDGDPPTSASFSTVLLGGSPHDIPEIDSDTLGFSINGVDFANRDPGDTAIVFTDAFDASLFSGTPLADEIGLAIGNVAAHETGHLLGLLHVSGNSSLMNFASAATFQNVFLEFTSTSFDDSVFPIGFHYSPMLLSETVGAYAQPASIIAADLNGDGLPDLATANSQSNDVSVLLNLGEALFAAPHSFPTAGELPRSIAAGDFDGDGAVDLAVANLTPRDRALAVLENVGSGELAPPVGFEVGSPLGVVAVADIDADGDSDVLAIADLTPGDATIALNADGAFDETVEILDNGGAVAGVFVDVDGDGALDVAIATGNTSADPGHVLIFRHLDPLVFLQTDEVTVGEGVTAITAGDLNNDGAPDLAVAHRFSDDVFILINDGEGAFTVIDQVSVGRSPFDIVSNDLDSDGDVDLVVADHGSTSGAGEVWILFNDGRASFDAPVSVTAGARPVAVIDADFNGDGHPDLAVANEGDADFGHRNGGVSVLINNGDGSFAAPVDLRVGTVPDAD